MECRKNKIALLVLCFISVFSASLPLSTSGQQITFFKPVGGTVYPRWDTICLGGDLAFDVDIGGRGEGAKIELIGPFAITPFTDRNRWYTIAGIPGRNILLTAARFLIPQCAKPCTESCCVTPPPPLPPFCPVSAYSVHTFGVSLIPSLDPETTRW